METNCINIYEYEDYRQLLQDLYTHKKKQLPHFSYRYIAGKVGFSSAGFFSNILQGKRNISDRLLLRFAELFGFSERETDFFENLVHYTQATQHEQKRRHYQRMLALRKSFVHPLAAYKYQYFEKWYHVAIRGLLYFFEFSGNYKELAAKLTPKITEREAKESVTLLSKLDLIRKDDQGVYRVTEKSITTVPDVPLHAIHTFQKSAIELAKESIDRFEKPDRWISTLTLSVDQATYQAIVRRLTEFQREAMELAKGEQSGKGRVYHINFQIFPMTE